ncbi:MAG: mandelate racemase/muconate lactonizing enzyme family protein, partial [Halodesulfurarchaeum sp.]
MTDVRIRDVETHIVSNPWKPWVFVELTTNTGERGLAEATSHGKPRTVVAAIEEMAEYFIGESPYDTEDLWRRMYRDEWYSKNVINTTVISAIDTAAWDIKGRIHGEPLYEL